MIKKANSISSREFLSNGWLLDEQERERKRDENYIQFVFIRDVGVVNLIMILLFKDERAVVLSATL
jgi:hypothetical protein